jgi:hypothetical protein
LLQKINEELIILFSKLSVLDINNFNDILLKNCNNIIERIRFFIFKNKDFFINYESTIEILNEIKSILLKLKSNDIKESEKYILLQNMKKLFGELKKNF